MRYRGKRRKHSKSRRSKVGGFAVLIRILAKQHWLLNLALAVATYFVLSYFSKGGISGAGIGLLGPPGASSMEEVFAVVSSILKYILPLVFVVAAISSFAGSFKRKRLLSNVRTNKNLSGALSDLSWQEFELLVAQMFRERGYVVVEGAGSRDGGVDVTVRKSGRTHLVQCKHWRTSSVGVAVVRELFGVMTLRKAHGGFVVCSGKFTKDASAFAKKANVNLIGLNELEKHLG